MGERRGNVECRMSVGHLLQAGESLGGGAQGLPLRPLRETQFPSCCVVPLRRFSIQPRLAHHFSDARRQEVFHGQTGWHTGANLR